MHEHQEKLNPYIGHENQGIVFGVHGGQESSVIAGGKGKHKAHNPS